MDSVSSLIMPPQSSTIAGDVDALFYFILYAGLVMLGIVTVLSALFVLKYRRSKRAKTSGVDHNTTLEIIWTAIPTVLVIIVFVWGFRGFMKMNIVPKDAIEIKVTGQQWFWSFDYSDGVTTINELIVPNNKPIKLLMSSRDVIHSFFVPEFRLKMDVLPNRYTVTWFEAPRQGTYNVFCAEFCGKGHSAMIGSVKVVGQAEYVAWLEEGAALSSDLPPEVLGAKLFVAKACNTCHKMDGSSSTGPPLNNIYGHAVPLENGTEITVDENYLRESMLNPSAKVVAGFQPVMPTYQGLLRNHEIDALIAYIKSLQKGEESTSE